MDLESCGSLIGHICQQGRILNPRARPSRAFACFTAKSGMAHRAIGMKFVGATDKRGIAWDSLGGFVRRSACTARWPTTAIQCA